MLKGESLRIPQNAWVMGGIWLDTPLMCLHKVFGRDLSQVAMSRTDWRIVQYHERPYLRHLTDGEIAQRFADVMGLPETLVHDNNTIGLVSAAAAKGGGFSVEWGLLSDVFEECRFRYHGNSYPPGHWQTQDSMAMVRPLNADRLRAAQTLSRRLHEIGTKRAVVKFGKAKHMRRLFEGGYVRMTAASRYSNMGGDNARQDNERKITLNTVQGKKTVVKCSDYWMFCVAKCTDDHPLLMRLFHDFDADACVAIQDFKEFFVRLQNLCRHMIPNTKAMFGSVRYVDPVLDAVVPSDLPMTKHFRFMYQKEVRMACVPVNAKPSALKPIDLRIGSMKDYATYID